VGGGVGGTLRTLRGYFPAVWRGFYPVMVRHTTEGVKRPEEPENSLKFNFVFLYKNSATLSLTDKLPNVSVAHDIKKNRLTIKKNHTDKVSQLLITVKKFCQRYVFSASLSEI
jgi:hypothetical protein